MGSQFGVKKPTMGLNNNLDFLGKELHVQTENVNSEDPYIITQVFFSGRVIQTTKYEYSTEIRGIKNFARISDLMHEQHTKVIENINKKQETYQNSPDSRQQYD